MSMSVEGSLRRDHSRDGSVGVEPGSFQWSQSMGRSRSPSLDWPLSCEEKKVRVMELFQKDVCAADEMLRTSEKSIVVLRDEIQRLHRRHSWSGTDLSDHGEANKENLEITNDCECAEPYERTALVVDCSHSPIKQDTKIATTCIVDRSSSPERTSNAPDVKPVKKGKVRSYEIEEAGAGSPERIMPEVKPSLDADHMNPVECTHKSAPCAMSYETKADVRLFQSADPVKGLATRIITTGRCWRSSRGEEPAKIATDCEQPPHRDVESHARNATVSERAPHNDGQQKRGSGEHSSQRSAGKKIIASGARSPRVGVKTPRVEESSRAGARTPRVEDSKYIYFSRQTPSPCAKEEAHSRAKSEGKKGKCEKQLSQTSDQLESRSVQNRGRPREGRCWKSQARTQQASSVHENDEQTSQRRRLSLG